jgi:methionyl-tRNA formyltransferase
MPLRVAFFGTPAFAVPALTALAEAGHIIAAVVTQPDRPRGRGQKVQPSDVKAAAAALGVPVLQPTRIKDASFAAELSALQADLGVVAAYGRILPAALLTIPRLGMVNVHASLLPRWRGAAPVHRAILAGDSVTGVTIMRVVEALDAGPMLARTAVDIELTETSAELERRLAALGAELLADTVNRLAQGQIVEEPQNEALVTYASRLERQESALDWAQPCLMVHNRIRGLQPWPVASSQFKGQRMMLRSSLPLPGETHDSTPGTVLRVEDDGIVVSTQPGAVRLTRIQLEGKAPVPVVAFLQGHHIEPGDRFGFPPPGTS